MLSRLLSLIRKEFLQLFRDWMVIVLILYWVYNRLVGIDNLKFG